MQGTKPDRQFVSLAEALSWIAFRQHLDMPDIKERLRSEPMAGVALDNAMQQFSLVAGDGRLTARGRYFAHIGENGIPQAGDTADIREYSFKDFQQFDIDLNRLQRLPANGSRVLGPTGIKTVTHAPDDGAHSTNNYTATADESYARAFQSFANSSSDDGASLGDGFLDVEVRTDNLVREYPAITPQRRKVSHEQVVAWCRQEIATGTNDMNRAWNKFKSMPTFAALSRDDAFRPAWKEAKTTS